MMQYLKLMIDKTHTLIFMFLSCLLTTFGQTDSSFTIQDKGPHKIDLTKDISPSDSITLNNYGKEFITIQSKLANEWTISSIMICEQWIEENYVRIPISKIEIKFTLKQRQNNPNCNNEITLSFYDICNKQKVLDKTKHLMLMRSTIFPPPPIEYFNDKYFVFYWDCYCNYEFDKIDNKCVSLKEFIIKHFNLK